MFRCYLMCAVLAGWHSHSIAAGQEDTDSIIRITRRSLDTNAVIREPALAKIKRSKAAFVLQLSIDLEKATDSKRVNSIATNLNTLLVPRPIIASHVNGSVHQSSLPRDIESTNANTVRPVKCIHSKKLRQVLHKKLAVEIKKYAAIGKTDWFDKSKANLANLQLQSDTFQAIQSVCQCLQNVGEIEDVFKLGKKLETSEIPRVTFCLTRTMQTILGFSPETYFNGRCGVGVTREMLEQERKKEKQMAEQVRTKVLEFLKANRDLDRAKAMELVVKKEFSFLTSKVNAYQAIHFGGSQYPLGFLRYGRELLEHLEANYDVKDGGRIQGNFEAMRAAMTSEFDGEFVKAVFENKIKFTGAKLCAINIITNAGSKKFKSYLLVLAKYVPPKKKSNKNSDYEMDYLVELRKQSAMALAACHGKNALDELKDIQPLDVAKTGYFDFLPYIIKEIEGRYGD